MGVFGFFANLLPFTSYPVSKDFRRRTTIVTLGICAVIIYGGLTVWNILTQGKDPVYTSVLQDDFANNGSIKCTARGINVGDSFFTRPTGHLQWYLTSVNTLGKDGTGFAYNGNPLEANITFVSLLYQFSGQSYSYEVCANASVPYLTALNDTNTHDRSTIISMCANFDLTRNSGPSWAASNQSWVENKVFGLGPYLQQLQFANGTFPMILFPPYGSAGTPPTDTTITPDRAYDLSVWLDDFLYLPNPTPSTGTENNGFGATHQMIVLNNSQQTTDIATVFETTLQSSSSGIQLDLNGIGGLRLQTTALNQAINFNEPNTITQMRNYSLNTLNTILDLASNDLQSKVIQGGYLCTITTETWKKPLSLVAMILGNNSSLFGFILGILISAAAWHEESRSRPIPDMDSRRDRPIQLTPSRGSTYDRVSSGHEYYDAKASKYNYIAEDAMPVLHNNGYSNYS